MEIYKARILKNLKPEDLLATSKMANELSIATLIDNQELGLLSVLQEVAE